MSRDEGKPPPVPAAPEPAARDRGYRPSVTIHVVTVGPVEEDVIQAAEMAAWLTFARDVRRLPPQPNVAAAFDPARSQWISSEILAEASRLLPEDGFRLLALTEVDLYIPMLSFVFGQAQLGGRSALVSTARLRPEFHGFPGNRTLLLSRLAKEVIHELGHTFGLVHCTDPACPMSLSTTILQVDSKGSAFCARCLFAAKKNSGRACEAGPAGTTT